MSGKEKFIEVVDGLLKGKSVEKEVTDYFEWFKTTVDSKEEKPAELSDKAQAVLKYMQDNPSINLFKAKSIADALGVNSKSVSGTLRKLRTDGYITKVSDEGVSPIIYSLKEKK